jgi:hypothetical protein
MTRADFIMPLDHLNIISVDVRFQRHDRGPSSVSS